MVMPNKNSPTQMSKSTNNLSSNHHQLNYDTNNNNAFSQQQSAQPPPPPPFVLDSSPNNPATRLAANASNSNSNLAGLTSSASATRLNPTPSSAGAGGSGAGAGGSKPTKPSTFSMLSKGFKHIFSNSQESKSSSKDNNFTRDNANYQSERLGNNAASGRTGGSAESPSSPDEAKTMNRSDSSSQSKQSLGSMNDYAIYDDAAPVPQLPPRPERGNSVASATTPTPTTPPSIISNNGSWVAQGSCYGQQLSSTSSSTQRGGGGGGALPHSQTTTALMNHHQQQQHSSSSESSSNYRPSAPPLPLTAMATATATAGVSENDELNEIDRLVDFTTNEERMNLQRKGCNILASQIEAKKARIVSMETDVIELRHVLEQYRSPDDIDRLKHEIRELTNEKAQLEIRIIQNSSWQCDKCTFKNKSEAVVCEMCDKDKEGGEIIICEQCRTKNPLYKVRCLKCGSQLLADNVNNNASNIENTPSVGAGAGAGAASYAGQVPFIRPTRPAPPIPPRRTASNTSNNNNNTATTSSVPHTPNSTPSPQAHMLPYAAAFNGQQPTIPHVPGSTSPGSAAYSQANQNVYFPRTPLSYPNIANNLQQHPQQAAQQPAPQPSPRGNSNNNTNNSQQAAGNSSTRI